MKRTLLLMGISLAIVLMLSLMAILVWKGAFSFDKIQNKIAEQIKKNAEMRNASYENQTSENVSGEEFSDDMSEGEVQQAIHNMSHQKVKADRKWGALEITPQHINRLIEIVKNNDFENADLYLEILNSWKEGDFSNIVDDHNAIWELQDGTVGEATGVLSPKEEKQYIDENF